MGSPSLTAAARWNRTLRCFRFHFAHGGHANDMDTLSATLCFRRGEAGLRDLFRRLDLGLAAHQPGRAGAEPIAAYPAYSSPGFVRLFGMPANLAVREEQVEIYLSGAHGDIWTIDEADFRHALALESLLPERGVALAERTPLEELERRMLALLEAGPGADRARDTLDEASRELQALRRVAAASGAKPNLLAYRFPGYSGPFIERICAQVAPRA